MRRPGLAAFYTCCAVFLMLFSHAELIKANDVFSVPWEALLGLIAAWVNARSAFAEARP